MDGHVTESATTGAAISGVGPVGLRRRLVNEFQRDLPVSPRPFREVAERLGWTEASVLAALRELQHIGTVSRVGPVIRPNTIGASALAAMAVPPQKLERTARLVSRRPEVNHNYEREHRFNLWFVMTTSDSVHLEAVAGEIERCSGLQVMVLPMLDDYYIDLGFDLDGRGGKPDAAVGGGGEGALAVDATDRRLLEAMQDGLPLVARPYESVGRQLGLTGMEVRRRVTDLLGAGVIKRLGVVVRHHECGWRHNAMVVWDVPDQMVHAAGTKLAGLDAVRLCYRRPRCLPEWPYNLYCMIHGKDRGDVLGEVTRVTDAAGLESLPRAVLFSVRRFKQRGARYGGFEAGAGGGAG